MTFDHFVTVGKLKTRFWQIGGHGSPLLLLHRIGVAMEWYSDAYAEEGWRAANESAHSQWQLAAHFAFGLLALALLLLNQAQAHLEQLAWFIRSRSIFTSYRGASILCCGGSPATALENASSAQNL